jgi:hypothetical protein
MSRLNWQSTPFITNVAPGTLPSTVEMVAGRVDTRGEESLLLSAKVVGGGSILCETYVWNGTEYVHTKTDYKLDADFPIVEIAGGAIYAFWISATEGVVTSWNIRYGLETT